jgi:hypothetical protein
MPPSIPLHSIYEQHCTFLPAVRFDCSDRRNIVSIIHFSHFLSIADGRLVSIFIITIHLQQKSVRKGRTSVSLPITDDHRPLLDAMDI